MSGGSFHQPTTTNANSVCALDAFQVQPPSLVTTHSCVKASDFSVKKYIDALLRKTPPVQTDGGEADASRDDLLPFITAFEGNLKELHALRQEVAEKIAGLTAELEGGDMREACSALRMAFLDVASQADDLETRFDDLGHEPLETGKRLAHLLDQRRRAECICSTLEHLRSFQSGLDNPPGLVDLIDKDPARGAKIVRCLWCVSEALLDGGTKDMSLQKATANIRDFATATCQQLAASFRESLAAGRPDDLARLYSMLQTINGGEVCRRSFVLEHSLVRGVKVVPHELRSVYYLDKAKVPVVIRCGREEPDEPIIKELLDRIVAVLSSEEADLTEVFSDDDMVVAGELVNQVLVDQMRPMVTECLRQARQHSWLAHQRALHSYYLMFSRFAGQLDSLMDGLADMVSDSIDTILQASLKTLVADEKTCLDELVRLSLQPLAGFVGKRKRGEAPKKTAPQSPAHLPAPSVERAVLFMFADGLPLAVLDPGAEHQGGVLTMDTVQRGLILLAEAGGRVVALVGTSTAEHLLPALLHQTLGSYSTALSDMVEAIVQGDPPRYGFDAYMPRAMQSCHSALSVVQIWFEQYYGLLAISVSPGCYAECVRIKNDSFRLVEGRVSGLSNHMHACMIDFVKEHYFKQQRRSDFHPKDDAEVQTAMGKQVTPCCEQLVLYVRKCARAVKECVEEALAGPWLYRLGCLLLHSLLHDHLKRFVVNEAGAVLLLRDCSHYAQCIPGDLIGGALTLCPWEAQLSAHYAALREIAKLFVVKADNLQAVLQEGALAGVDKGLVQPFLMNRADARVNAKAFEKLFPGVKT